MTFIYEDELPEDISDVEYDNWFKQSWVEGVRIGPRLHFSTKNCWCCPTLDYVDPDTGNGVYVHKQLM